MRREQIRPGAFPEVHRPAQRIGDAQMRRAAVHRHGRRRGRLDFVERARETDVPVIENTGVEETVRAVIELVLGAEAEHLERV